MNTKIKRGIIALSSIILIAIVSLICYYFLNHHKERTRFKTIPVEKGDVVLTVTATGSLSALTTVQVGTQVNGTICKLYSDFNDQVHAGQLIALLDTVFLATAKDDAQAIVQRSEVQLDQNELEYERSKSLFEIGAISKSEYDLARTNYRSALSALTSAKAQLNRARINLQYASIKAPIDGIIISRNVDVGQTVISSFNSPVLFTIANDLRKMELIANVDEADIGQVKVGQDVIFSVDAYPEKQFYGKVKQIRLQPVMIQNVVNYAVIINVPNPDLKLMPGLTANISIIIAKDTAVLKVPVNAINVTIPVEYLNGTVISKRKTSPGSGLLLIKDGDHANAVYVETGLNDGSFIAVKGNVKPGDELITGILMNSNEKTEQVQNPFMPKMIPRGARK